MIAICAVWLIAQASGGCAADKVTATRALEAMGLREVRLGGYPWFECAKNDVFNSAFEARSATGGEVRGAVCCGVLKGCTVRFR